MLDKHKQTIRLVIQTNIPRIIKMHMGIVNLIVYARARGRERGDVYRCQRALSVRNALYLMRNFYF